MRSGIGRYGNRQRTRAGAADIAGLRILSVLPDRMLADLADDVWLSSYPRGEEIEWQDTGEGDGLVLGVLEGEIGISFLSYEGKELLVLSVGGGALVDLGREGWAGTDVTIATVRSALATVCAFRHTAFERAVLGCPEAVQLLLLEQQRWLRELGGAASDRLHGPGGRIRHTLWRDTRDIPDSSIRYTHEQLATRAGTDRAFATKELGQLVRAGIIAVERREHLITVLDADRLTDEAN